jgi:hypothetical protein
MRTANVFPPQFGKEELSRCRYCRISSAHPVLGTDSNYITSEGVPFRARRRINAGKLIYRDDAVGNGQMFLLSHDRLN